jgi:hypothetical protein
MSPSPRAPLVAAETLAWMSASGAELRVVLAEESALAMDEREEDDAAIRAHLRFAALAMEQTAREPLREELAGFCDALPEAFAEGRELLEDHVARGAGAIALEEHLQFGTSPGTDPSLDASLERRVRITGWMRIFLIALEERLGPAEDGFEQAVEARFGARHLDLARLILSLDNEALGRAGAAGVTDAATRIQIGQVAVIQGHVRLMVEAVAATLARDGAAEAPPP